MFVRDRINEELKGFSLYEHYFEVNNEYLERIQRHN